jgi:hypothetical protein
MPLVVMESADFLVILVFLSELKLFFALKNVLSATFQEQSVKVRGAFSKTLQNAPNTPENLRPALPDAVAGRA